MEDKIITSPDCDDIYMPLSILHDKRLRANEKFYLSMYYQYGDSEYYADRKMKQICSVATLIKVKKKLRALNLIEEITDYQQAKELVLKRKGQGQKCEWCGEKTFALQEHHFPIPAHKGGKETVLICPNCHFEYHSILKNKE